MKNISGTFTENNLLRAFAGESQARNRYTFFASQARKEGYMQIADIFAETADHEKEHAERFFRYLNGGEVEIRASFPAGVIGSTIENLAAAAAGEYDEWNNLYPSFAETARDEGFNEIARCFEFISVSERQHERRYRGLLKNVTSHNVFSREREVMWRCRNCGYLHYGKSVPELCPACQHEKGYFELLAENC